MSTFKVDDYVMYGNIEAKVTAVLPDDCYRIEWTNRYREWMCVDIQGDNLYKAPTPQDPLPAPILAAYHKWLAGGFDPVFIARAIEDYLKGEGK